MGPGGVGKTRLALAVADDLAAAFEAVAFVPLAPLASPDLVPAAIAAAVGVRDTGDLPLVERLRAGISRARVLLVLDNAEHLLAAATVIAELVQWSPDLTVLVTSRAVLNVAGERVVPLAPFASAMGRDADEVVRSDAVRFFVERATAASADFRASPGDLPLLASICARVDGLPLAIELAAARTRHLAVPDLLGRLDDRLPVLTGGPLGGPSRFRTMRETIAWSVDLLAADDARLFRHLAVFAGGWTLPVLERFFVHWRTLGAPDPAPPDILATLGSLVDQSLVLRRTDAAGDTRYDLLETVREFAAERLAAAGETEAARAAHVAAFLEWAEAAKPRMFGPEQSLWLERAEAEHPNLRAALGRALERAETAVAARLAAAVLPLWLMHDHMAEARRWLDQVMALPGDAPAETQSVIVFGAGNVAAFFGDVDRAIALARSGVTHAEAAGDRFGEAITLLLLGGLLLEQGDLDAVERAATEALARSRALPGQPRLAAVLSLLADIASVRDDPRFAERVAAFVDAARRSGDVMMEAIASLQQAELAQRGACLDDALAHVRLGIARWRAVGSPSGPAAAVAVVAAVVAAHGDRLLAVRWSGTADAVVEATGGAPSVMEVARRERVWGDAESRHGRAEVEAALAAGRALTIELALAEIAAYVPPAAPAVTSPTPRPRHGLTPREIEVLRLVADGQSNRAISDALGISPRTTAAHLVNILNKLGLDSRTAAAAHAIRSGIA